MGKRMEGDNKQRRKRARKARGDEGVAPSKAQVTTGASKQRESLPHKAAANERHQGPWRGKQRTDVDRGPSRRKPLSARVTSALRRAGRRSA